MLISDQYSKNKTTSMDQTPKQQVAEKLRQAANVLVTVSKDPSVDQLAAGIGLTLMLNKLGKHTTAVFSGKIPDVMQFLEPEKTFAATVDSLRDFIVSIAKDKADKLRYKVDGDVVKIFITPYRTTITKDDIKFEQGDFNVDAVVALGVTNRDDVDAAIVAHGRILHDATVISVNTGDTVSTLGSIDWHEPTAGSLSEMLVSISEALEGNLLDAQMATAFLTGIVSATDRFSNERTSPKVMTMAAQLMAAGANQQLIATNLGKDGQIMPGANAEEPGVLNVADDGSPNEASAIVSHDVMPALDLPKPAEPAPEDIVLQASLPPEPTPTPEPTVPEPAPVIEPVQPEPAPAITPARDDKAGIVSDARGFGPHTEWQDNPTLGGTFNATSDAAHEAAKLDKENLNNEILSHAGAKSEQAEAEASLEKARQAVASAMQAQEFTPEHNPLMGVGAQPMPLTSPDLPAAPDLNTMPPVAPPPLPPPLPDFAAPAAPNLSPAAMPMPTGPASSGSTSAPSVVQPSSHDFMLPPLPTPTNNDQNTPTAPL